MSKYSAKVLNVLNSDFDYIVTFNILDSENTIVLKDQSIRMKKKDVSSFKKSRFVEEIFERLQQKLVQSQVNSTDESDLVSLLGQTIILNTEDDDASRLVLDLVGDVNGSYEFGEILVEDSPAVLNIQKVSYVTRTLRSSDTDALWVEIRRGMGDLSTITPSLSGGVASINVSSEQSGVVEVTVGDQSGTMKPERIKLRWKTKAVVLTSPNGTKYKASISNGGAVTWSLVT